ncbi:MAG: hypothetical protein JWR85_1459, partial [Marmoricola sp.]|nr:hypothetical protein [Marmoricola sp.]
VLWWCLATGTAQASDGPQRDLGTPARAVTGPAAKLGDKPARHAVDRVGHGARTVTTKTHPVRHHAAPVVSTVQAPARKSPAGPIVTAATTTVRTTISPVVEPTRAVLETRPLGSFGVPVLDGSKSVVHPTLAGESPTLQGEPASEAALATGVASGLADLGSPIAPNQDRAGSGSPVEQHQNDPALGSSASTDTSSAPSGSGSGAGLCESGHIVAPAATLTSSSTLAERRVAGPAYPPASSPG